MRKVLAFITTAIIACVAITCITTALIAWDIWVKTDTSAAVAQTTGNCVGDPNKKCLDINVYEALNIMPREDRPLFGPRLGAYYNGSSSPPNPLVIKQGESVSSLFIGPQYFLPPSYEAGEKFVPHVGAGLAFPLLYPSAPEPVYTYNRVTFNSGDPSNPQEKKQEFGHAGTTDEPPSPTSAQYLIATSPMIYNNVGEFVATARVQMIRHFLTVCSPSNWAFVPNTSDLCTSGQSPGRHSNPTEDRLIDITVSRLIKVVPQ